MGVAVRPAEPGEHGELGETTAQAHLRDGLLGLGGGRDACPGEPGHAATRAAVTEVPAAVEHGGVPGGVTFVPGSGPMACMAGPGEAGIRMLAVAHAARGRGVGEALVRACVDRARAVEGCVRVVLPARRTVHSAPRVHERLGSVRTPGRDRKSLPHLDDITLLTYELTL
ncbi:GNAT family N-acetyltransferase [Streptomyces sp. enrichment culture]|uniref:GNAT family N-acetyltransferase n=1 Tax=Streptomyces sp. enrichment culture TaxID=1795815 RepID=UPI003F5555DE